LKSSTITISKSYNQSTTTWDAITSEEAAIAHIIAASGLHSEEREALAQVRTIEALKKHLAGLGAASTERHKALTQHLEKHFKRNEASLAVIDFLKLPKFFFFSQYDRMSGQVALEQMLSKQAQGTLDRNDMVFLAFLSLVGTTLQDIAKLDRFEPLIAKLEAVSNRISREIFAYWSQNKNLKVHFRLDAGRAGDPSPFDKGNILRTRI
jgi:hypothetical protein